MALPTEFRSPDCWVLPPSVEGRPPVAWHGGEESQATIPELRGAIRLNTAPDGERVEEISMPSLGDHVPLGRSSLDLARASARASFPIHARRSNLRQDVGCKRASMSPSSRNLLHVRTPFVPRNRSAVDVQGRGKTVQVLGNEHL